MAVSSDFLRLAAIVLFVVTGLLLVLGDGVSLRTGLALTCAGLACFAASALGWWTTRRP